MTMRAHSMAPLPASAAAALRASSNWWRWLDKEEPARLP
jgi:hypothetical protein